MEDKIIAKFGDHGADSSRRDRFQEHFAAYYCVQMLFDGSILEVICEYGEDVVVNRNQGYELHQVKTKQESVSEWNLADLYPIIAKTFAMVPYFDKVKKCCFVSNKGSSGVLYELKKVINQSQSDWNEQEREFFETFCTNHAARILSEMKNVDSENNETVLDVRQRLLTLEINTDFHHMNHVEDSNIRTLRKFLDNDTYSLNNYSDKDIGDIYDNLIGIVGKATIGRTRVEKTITRNQVLECIVQPRGSRLLYKLPSKEEIENAQGRTLLEKKLFLGGFTDLFVEDARELMVVVKSRSRNWEFGQAAEILDDIVFRVKHLCVDSYDKVCQENPKKEQIGREIFEDIKIEFPRLLDYYHNSNLAFIDQLFLEGIAWALTSECKLYWSQQNLS